jgi:uncharacterized protein
MNELEEAVLLRAFIREDDKCSGLPLYEAIVLRAREMHLAGATVLRGPLSFGQSNQVHTAKILRLSFELPVIIEIVDTRDRIDHFLPVLDELMSTGIVTLEKVSIVRYGQSERLRRTS